MRLNTFLRYPLTDQVVQYSYPRDFRTHAALGSLLWMIVVAVKPLYTSFYPPIWTAINRRVLQPDESLESVAGAEVVKKSTLHDRITGTHAPRSV